MTDRPIIFSGPMVRSLLREVDHPGTGKTQTRRLLYRWKKDKEGNPAVARIDNRYPPVLDFEKDANGVWTLSEWASVKSDDRLWVREAHYMTDNGDAMWPVFAADSDSVREHFKDIAKLSTDFPADTRAALLKLRPSIHMPRWASRLTLTVTDVRVQRLQEISRDDVIAEGITERDGLPIRDCVAGWHEPYAALWDSLNRKRAPWDSDPWIVALTFTVAHGNIDALPKQVAA